MKQPARGASSTDISDEYSLSGKNAAQLAVCPVMHIPRITSSGSVVGRAIERNIFFVAADAMTITG